MRKKRTTKATRTSTECRSKVGITVALIDSLIAICRVLAPRLRMPCGAMEEDPIAEALTDLKADMDFTYVFEHCPLDRTEQEREKLTERLTLIRTQHRSPDQESRLRELDEFVSSLPTAQSRAAQTFETLLMQFARDIPSGVAPL